MPRPSRCGPPVLTLESLSPWEEGLVGGLLSVQLTPVMRLGLYVADAQGGLGALVAGTRLYSCDGVLSLRATPRPRSVLMTLDHADQGRIGNAYVSGATWRRDLARAQAALSQARPVLSAG